MVSLFKYKSVKRLSAAFACIVIIFSLCVTCVSAKTVSPKYFNSMTLSEFASVEAPDTLGYANIVINLETESVMFDKRSQDRVFPASTVKIMTAIIAYEEIEDLSVEVTASEIVNSSSGKRLGIEEGDVYTAGDLLHALLLTGANDAALVLAEYVGGTVENFVDMMNAKADKIGAQNTYYKNPTGLHNSEMSTTARDTAIIASYAYYINDLTEMSSLTNYYITPKNKPDETHLLYNRNSFVSRSNGITQYYYSGAKGLNAGSTEQAGNCLVTTASKNGLTYLCVVMAAPTTDEVVNSYTDAKLLLDACFDNFKNTSVVSTGKVICEVPIRLVANVDHMTLYPESTLEALLPTSLDPEKDIVFDRVIYQESVDAPISKGERFGELLIKYKDDYPIGKVYLVADSNYERSRLLYFFDRIESFLTSKFFIVTVISAVILTVLYLIISYRINKRKRMF